MVLQKSLRLTFVLELKHNLYLVRSVLLIKKNEEIIIYYNNFEIL